MRFTLANGRQVDLDMTRLEERQRGLRVMLPTRASVRDFAPLIDVVLFEGDGDSFRFTELSAAQWLEALRGARATEFDSAKQWVQARIGSMWEALRRLPRVPDNHYAAVVAVPPMCSTLPAEVRALRLRRASVSQWIATLHGLTGKGVKAEEIECAGVLDRLGRIPAQVRLTDNEVIALVDLTPATPRLIEESRFAFVATAPWEPCCERIPARQFRRRGLMGPGRDALHVVRYRHLSLGWSVVRTRYRDLVTERIDWWTVLDEKGNAVGQPVYGFATPNEAIAFAQERMGAHFATWGRDSALNRWEQYSLPGGSSYRELLVQLHDWPSTYISKHYRSRNVLAHVRTSLRTDAHGRRLFYLDEVQSDWHADGQAAHGSTNDLPAAPFAREWALLVMKVMLWWAQRQGAEGLAWSSPELQRRRWLRPPAVLYEESLPKAARALSKALNLPCGRAEIAVRRAGLAVAAGQRGWEVRAPDGHPITKPFARRDQAEAYAGLLRGFEPAMVPVLWLDGIPPIKAISLFGVDTREAWFGSAPDAA